MTGLFQNAPVPPTATPSDKALSVPLRLHRPPLGQVVKIYNDKVFALRKTFREADEPARAPRRPLRQDRRAAQRARKSLVARGQTILKTLAHLARNEGPGHRPRTTSRPRQIQVKDALKKLAEAREQTPEDAQV